MKICNSGYAQKKSLLGLEFLGDRIWFFFNSIYGETEEDLHEEMWVMGFLPISANESINIKIFLSFFQKLYNKKEK